MSTYLYLRCESHNPPLENGDESGQHLYDLEQIWADLDNRDRIAAAWNDDMTPDDHFRHHTARFLAAHPHCQIGVVDEYGDTHHPDGTTRDEGEQVSKTIAEQIGLLNFPDGLSGQAMLAVKLGLEEHQLQDGLHHPHDPADLHRCIKTFGWDTPEFMRGVTPTWTAYVEHWDELVATFKSELENPYRLAPKTYALMQEIMLGVYV